MNQQGSTVAAVISWLALVIAIIALLLGWTAYNRTGEDLERRIQRGVEQGLQAVQEQTPDQPTQPQAPETEENQAPTEEESPEEEPTPDQPTTE